MKPFCIVKRDNNEERAAQCSDFTPNSDGTILVIYVGNYDERVEWVHYSKVRKVSTKQLTEWYTSKTTLSGMYLGPLSDAS